MARKTEDILNDIGKIRRRNMELFERLAALDPIGSIAFQVRRANDRDVTLEIVRNALAADPQAATELLRGVSANDAAVLSLGLELTAEDPRPYSVPEFKSIPEKRAVLLPGGGVLHTYAVREALALDLTPIVTDRDPNCPCAKIPGVEFHQIDCYDADWHANFVKDLPEDDVAGAFCGGADTHVTVAAIHEAMDWVGRWVTRETAETCKDKLKAKEALLAAGVPTPHRAMVGPMVIKPRSGSGSRGVKRIDGMMDLYDDSRSFTEERLEGPEQSVEILLRNGITFYDVNIVDRHFAWVDDQPLEWGHTNPTRLSERERDALYSLCESAAIAVGATDGFFKCDTIWTKDGPKVLECTPRLSGGYDSQISTPMSSGRNLLRYGLQLACGLPLDETLLERTKNERVTIIHRPELAGAASQKA